MRILRTIIFLLVCVALLWVAVMLLVRIFNSGDKSNIVAGNSVGSYARSGTYVQFIMDGPVVMDQEHKQIRITVDNTQNKIELISGYEGNVVRQDVFPSTSESYEVFLESLGTQGFGKSRTSVIKNEVGQCPLQNRYIYRLNDGNRDVYRLWSTSCNTGNFAGSVSNVRSLFKRQIPEKTYGEYSREFSR